MLSAFLDSKGNGYDNTRVESFFHILKVEAIHGENFATREKMRRGLYSNILKLTTIVPAAIVPLDIISPMAFEVLQHA